jgi:hypothetical protein
LEAKNRDGALGYNIKEVQVADKVVMAVRDAEKLSDKLQNQVKRMLGKMGWT